MYVINQGINYWTIILCAAYGLSEEKSLALHQRPPVYSRRMFLINPSQLIDGTSHFSFTPLPWERPSLILGQCNPCFLNSVFEHTKLPAKLLAYFL